MARKNKGTSGKKVAKRVDSHAKPTPKKAAQPSESAPEKPRMPERIREKDAGFGVIKVVIGGILFLIVGSMVLFNQAGGRENTRGDKTPGERCDETVECASGSICYSYKGGEKRCMTRCSKEKNCDLGFSCVAAAQQKRRKGLRLTDICVESDKL